MTTGSAAAELTAESEVIVKGMGAREEPMPRFLRRTRKTAKAPIMARAHTPPATAPATTPTDEDDDEEPDDPAEQGPSEQAMELAGWVVGSQSNEKADDAHVLGALAVVWQHSGEPMLCFRPSPHDAAPGEPAELVMQVP